MAATKEQLRVCLTRDRGFPLALETLMDNEGFEVEKDLPKINELISEGVISMVLWHGQVAFAPIGKEDAGSKKDVT